MPSGLTTFASCSARAARLALVVASVALPACDDAASGSGGSSSATTGSGEGGSGGEGATSSAVSTAASVTSASSTSATTGSGLIPCSQAYATFPKGECDLLQQDCPPGFHCDTKNAGGGVQTTQCVERGGLKGLASECTNENECEAGLFCVFSVCTPVCCRTSDEPCAGGNCNVQVTIDANDSVWMCTYSKQCVPLTAGACPEDTACHFEEPTVPTCIPPSGNDVPEGEPCASLNDCGNMQQCSPLDGRCRFICSVAPNSQPPGFGGCPVGQDCTETDQIGFEGLGVCRE